MTKYFPVSEKKLKNRYNKTILAVNILPMTVVLTLIAVVLFSKGSSQPISYYYGIFVLLSASLGFSFISVLIGSLIMTKRLHYNKLHTFVEIKSKNLIVSRYYQAVSQGSKMLVFKKLWIVKLSEIEDIYYYKRNIVVIAPTRLINQQADWLNYSSDSHGIKFENWWYDSNGGKRTGGVEIRDMFANPQRIARTIQTASGKMQQKASEYKEFRERMLKIAERIK